MIDRRWVVSISQLLIGSAIVIAGIQCTGQSGGERDEFLDLTPAERRSELSRRSPEDRVRLFLIASRAEHPRDLGLSDALASSGGAVVPPIVAYLSSERDELSRTYLLEVLEMMSRFGYYDVRANQTAIAAARRTVENITDPRLQSQAEASLREILGVEAREGDRVD
jgi:hypothetical protein